MVGRGVSLVGHGGKTDVKVAKDDEAARKGGLFKLTLDREKMKEAGFGLPMLLFLLAVLVLRIYYQRPLGFSIGSPLKKRQRSPCVMRSRRTSLLMSYLIMSWAVGPASCIGPDPILRRAGPGSVHRQTDETITTAGIDDTTVNDMGNSLRKKPREEDTALASNSFTFQVTHFKLLIVSSNRQAVLPQLQYLMKRQTPY